MTDDLERAFDLHRAGRLEAAAQQYQLCLKIDARNWEALHGLGVVYLQQGRLDEAARCLDLVARLAPDFAVGFNSLAACRLRRSDAAEALAAVDRAVGLEPDFRDAWFNRGVALRALSRFSDAAESFLHAAALPPGSLGSVVEAARCFASGGNPERSLKVLQRGLLDFGPRIPLLVARGEIHLGCGRLDTALEDADAALAVGPDDASARNLRGLVHLRLGRAEQALEDFEVALKNRPDYFEAGVHKGLALRQSGRVKQSRDWLVALETRRPESLEARYNRALAEQDLGQYGEAERLLLAVVATAPRFVAAWVALGSVRLEMGQPESSASAYREAYALEPSNSGALSGALLAQAYLPDGGGDERVDPRETARVLAAGGDGDRARVAMADRSRQRLRLGFVSGDFRDHVVVHFLEGVLRHLDRSRFELIAFPTLAVEDAVTRRLRTVSAKWQVLSEDPAAAHRQVDALEPDILIDVSGHTAHNRLSLFAARAAPVQVSWLGYWATTGLREIDYIIVDPVAWRAGDGEFFAETPWVLPETRLCFTPPADAPPILPAFGDRREIVFSAFGNPSKLNDRVIKVWARILRELPTSTLWLKARAYGDDRVRGGVIERFGAVGVASEKLVFEPHTPRRNYLADYNRVDIVLDTFPFPGGTTTAEALWMGVPVLTLAGNTLIGRQGESMLVNAGMADWVAYSEEDFIDKAVRAAADIERLRAERVGTRERLRSMPLYDAQRFARHLGEAFNRMWDARSSSMAGS